MDTMNSSFERGWLTGFDWVIASVRLYTAEHVRSTSTPDCMFFPLLRHIVRWPTTPDANTTDGTTVVIVHTRFYETVIGSDNRRVSNRHRRPSCSWHCVVAAAVDADDGDAAAEVDDGGGRTACGDRLRPPT